MKQLKSLITIQKIAEKLINFEMGPLDDFVCQYIKLKNSMSRMYHELAQETSTRKLVSCSDRVRSCTA